MSLSSPVSLALLSQSFKLDTSFPPVDKDTVSPLSTTLSVLDWYMPESASSIENISGGYNTKLAEELCHSTAPLSATAKGLLGATGNRPFVLQRSQRNRNKSNRLYSTALGTYGINSPRSIRTEANLIYSWPTSCKWKNNRASSSR